MKVVTEMGNPFLATGHELFALETCDAMGNVVAMSLSKITEVQGAVGKKHFILNMFSVQLKETVCSRLKIIQTHERKQRKLKC